MAEIEKQTENTNNTFFIDTIPIDNHQRMRMVIFHQFSSNLA